MSANGTNDSARRRLPARGEFRRAGVFQVPVQISGWILHPQQPLSSVTVVVDGRPLGAARLHPYPAIAAMFPSLEHALLSGFHVNGCTVDDGAEIRRVTVIGCSADEAVEAVREFTVPASYPTLATDPPPHLLQRISGSTDLRSFYELGFEYSSEVYAATERFLVKTASPVILDWGCGCGRLAMQFRRHWPTANVYACDVDREAVGWCARNIADIDAFVSGLEPPLRLPPSSVDLVIGSSVLTHLDRLSQYAWLDELHRVLRPGGIAALSIHGEFAASFSGSNLKDRVTRDGIVDVDPDGALDSVLPPGYYRTVFQSRAHTIAAFTSRFRFREYLVAGLGGFQDLIVLQKPGSDGAPLSEALAAANEDPMDSA